MMILTPLNDPTKTGPTSFMTERNGHEVRCGMCRRPFYVNDETYRYVSETIEAGLDDPYRCEVCAEEYDDLAYEGWTTSERSDFDYRDNKWSSA